MKEKEKARMKKREKKVETSGASKSNFGQETSYRVITEFLPTTTSKNLKKIGVIIDCGGPGIKNKRVDLEEFILILKLERLINKKVVPLVFKGEKTSAQILFNGNSFQVEEIDQEGKIGIFSLFNLLKENGIFKKRKGYSLRLFSGSIKSFTIKYEKNSD